MELNFVCFKCPDCGSHVYPTGHTSKAEPKYTKKFDFPIKNPGRRVFIAHLGDYGIPEGWDYVPTPSDLGLPSDATTQDVRDRLEQLRKNNPTRYEEIISKVRKEYQLWWNDTVERIRASADAEEAKLRGKVQNLTRSEDNTGVTFDIERKPSKLEEDADGTVRFKCPQCGWVLATAKPAMGG